MRNARGLSFLVSISLFLGLVTASGFAANPHCSEVGGVILTNVGGFGTINNGHLTTMGIATGDLRGAVGVEILDATQNAFHVQHHWVTENGETLAVDSAFAHGTAVGDQFNLFAITDYQFKLSGGTGSFDGATGNLHAIGEIDLSTGQAVLRYSGTVCRK